MKTTKHKLSIFIFLLLGYFTIAQTEGVSIKNSPGAPHATAMLEVESSTKGILIPRVPLSSLTSNSPIATTPAEGLLVYNTTTNTSVPLSPGFYYWSGGVWKRLNSGPEIWKVNATNPNSIYYDAGGNTSTVTVGTTTTSVSNIKLDVIGVARFYAGGIGSGSSNSVPNNAGVFIGAPAQAGNWHTNEINVPSSTLDLQWGTSQGVTVGYGSPPGMAFLDVNGPCSWVSDSTMKKNFLQLNNVLPKITKMKGYAYNYKSEANGTNKHLGVIAQEVELQFPELVKSVNRAKAEGAVNIIKSVDYLGLTAVLLQAIKEQQVQIDLLKEQVQVLQNK